MNLFCKVVNCTKATLKIQPSSYITKAMTIQIESEYEHLQDKTTCKHQRKEEENVANEIERDPANK